MILVTCSPDQSPNAEPTPIVKMTEKTCEPAEGTTPIAPTSCPVSTDQPSQIKGSDTTKTEPEPDRDNAGSFIVFKRSGGVAGLQQQWVIYSDARIKKPDGTQVKVYADRVKTLFDRIKATGFLDLNESYKPPIPCLDCFTYSITVQINGQGKTAVMTDDRQQSEQLATTLDAIRTFLSTVRRH